MTLIISVGTADRVVQASDRRLTWRGGRYDDTSNKAVVVECENGRFALAYTGLGRLGEGDEPTDTWVVNVLRDAPNQPVQEVLEQLALKAAQVIGFTPGDLVDKDLTFVGVGFFTDSRALVFTCSNVLDEEGHCLPAVSEQFNNNLRVDRPFVGVHGVEDAAATVLERLESQLRSEILSSLSGAAVADLLVEGIREAAGHDAADEGIGRDCMSIVVYRDPSIPIQAQYHSQLGSEPNSYMPSQVSRVGIFANALSRHGWTDSPSAGVPFDQWPPLSIEVVVTNQGGVFRMTHKGAERLSHLALVVSKEAVDCRDFAEGFSYVHNSFVKRLPRLDPGDSLAIPVDAFQDLRTGQTLDDDTARRAFLTVVARLPSNEFGKIAAAVSELMI